MALLAYGGAGNQQGVAAPTEVTTYIWDAENRLREIQLLNGSRDLDPTGLE